MFNIKPTGTVISRRRLVEKSVFRFLQLKFVKIDFSLRSELLVFNVQTIGTVISKVFSAYRS